jgi:hypothetical protein
MFTPLWHLIPPPVSSGPVLAHLFLVLVILICVLRLITVWYLSHFTVMISRNKISGHNACIRQSICGILPVNSGFCCTVYRQYPANCTFVGKIDFADTIFNSSKCFLRSFISFKPIVSNSWHTAFYRWLFPLPDGLRTNDCSMTTPPKHLILHLVYLV